MKIVVIIQARMGSTRLPGKVMRDLGGDTVLARVVQRVRRIGLIDHVVIATTKDRRDDIIANECQRLDVDCFRGEELNVLDRYYQAAQVARADAIVRITSDCPLIEPEVSEKIIQVFLDRKPDYVSNTLTRSYPRGLDTEIVTSEALCRAWREAKRDYQRVHVTPYIYENPELFVIEQIVNESDCSEYRWTLDTAEDLAFLRTVYERMGEFDQIYWRDLLELLEREPELTELNSHIRMKALHEG
ncbi:MAG TPA: glycosyltransferase family protein [Terriglobales bacterium]|jgi:spore coat polysaccharide biosynthesis protein SpsF